MRRFIFFAAFAVRISPVASVDCYDLIVFIDDGIDQKRRLEHPSCFFEVFVYRIAVENTRADAGTLAETFEIKSEEMVCEYRALRSAARQKSLATSRETGDIVKPDCADQYDVIGFDYSAIQLHGCSSTGLSQIDDCGRIFR